MYSSSPKGVVLNVHVRDIRFPTSLQGDGSDAMHTDPDYSCAYVIVSTDLEIEGHGFAFTLGKGTEIVSTAVHSLASLVIGRELNEIFNNFGKVWRELTSDGQMRWLGPEKGVIHLATAAIVNALWDLWAKREGKPLWKLLVDMDPEQLLSTIDFRYMSDVLTKEEALEILKRNQETKADREAEVLSLGFPVYTTSIGWLGYSDDKIRQLCHEALQQGFTKFKVKVGADLEDDKRRLAIVREEIGYENLMMIDANQRWDIPLAKAWIKELKEFRPLWIEEPTSPDDILGHTAIAKEIRQYGIGVATGEQCHNRVMFKQLLQSNGVQFCQVDGCRLGGVNEVLAVCLMAAELGVPVCPHAGGVGLCEMMQHVVMWDYICCGASMENRMMEYVDHLHEHFVDPVKVSKGRVYPPQVPGYSTQMKALSLQDFEFPDGAQWKELMKSEKFAKFVPSLTPNPKSL